MRKLILRMSISLDGFVVRSNGELGWIFSNIDEESIAFGVAQLWEAGVHAKSGFKVPTSSSSSLSIC
jgi:hypothetical protein